MARKPAQSLILPDEIILHILSYLPEASTLFTIASLIDSSILSCWPWRDVQKLVNRHPLQLQRLIRFVVCERYGNVPTIEDLEHYLKSNVEGLDPLPILTASQWLHLDQPNCGHHSGERTSQSPAPPPLLVLDRIHSPAKIIYEMNALSSDVEVLLQPFIDRRLHRTHVLMQNAAEQDHLKSSYHGNSDRHLEPMDEDRNGVAGRPKQEGNVGSFVISAETKEPLDQKVNPPTATEIHRIRRACWRLILYSDLFHEPNPRYPSEGHTPGTPTYTHTYAIVTTLSTAELEEIDCIYHHLSQQIAEWRNPESIEYSPHLAERMLNIFGPVMNAWDYRTNERENGDYNARLERHITHFIGYDRELLGTFGWSQDTRTAWPDSTEANTPNAGWQYLHDNKDALGVKEGDFRMWPVTCYLEWGYCIWDAWRLEGWGVVGERAKQELWEDCGQKRMAWCAHCSNRLESRADYGW